MTTAGVDPSLRLHVERTRHPAVLRWVCRRRDLDVTPIPPAGSGLGALVGGAVLESAVVHDGDVWVCFADPTNVSDREMVGAVHRAVVAALALDGWRSDLPVGVSIRGAHR